MNNRVCCFFGHRKIKERELLRAKLYKIIEELITCSQVGVFLFGSKSEFDDLCREVVSELKKKYQYLHRIYIRAEYQHISKEYEEYLLQYYDETCFSKRALNVGKAVYILRNQEMIDKSDICVVYYEYIDNRQNSSGTMIAYEYALKNKKIILNTI